jgi:hypothetical protein
MRLFLISTVLCISMASCLPKPKKNYTPAELAGVGTLTEVMRVNAHYADPLFGVRDEASFSDAQFAQMVDASKMLEATAAHMLSSFAGKGDYDEGFADLSKKLGENATALLAAGESKNAAGASQALNAMLGSCKSCHSIYK